MNVRIKISKERLIQIFSIMIGIIYGIAVIYIVLLKHGFASGHAGVNLIPFVWVQELITKKSLPIFIFENIVGNTLLFLPFGMLGCIFFSSISRKKIIAAGIITSLTLELIQGIFSLGVLDIDDLITNSIGTFLGILVYEKITKRWDLSYENHLASLLLLCFLGVSSCIMMFFVRYANYLICL